MKVKVKLSKKTQFIINLIILNFAMFIINLYWPSWRCYSGRHMMDAEDLFLISFITNSITFSGIYIVSERSKWV